MLSNNHTRDSNGSNTKKGEAGLLTCGRSSSPGCTCRQGPGGGINDATTQAEHEVQGWLLLDVVVGQRASVLQLLTGEDQPLLVRRYPCTPTQLIRFSSHTFSNQIHCWYFKQDSYHMNFIQNNSKLAYYNLYNLLQVYNPTARHTQHIFMIYCNQAGRRTRLWWEASGTLLFG